MIKFTTSFFNKISKNFDSSSTYITLLKNDDAFEAFITLFDTIFFKTYDKKFPCDPYPITPGSLTFRYFMLFFFEKKFSKFSQYIFERP